MLTEVAHKVHAFDVVPLLAELYYLAVGPVGRSVIDENELALVALVGGELIRDHLHDLADSLL